MTTEYELRAAFVAALTAKFGDLATATPAPRTVRHFVARWLRKYGGGDRKVVGIRRFRVVRRRDGQITILLHGASGAVSAAAWTMM